MNREFKFRAWNPNSKTMHQEVGLHPFIMINHTMCDEDECGYVAEGTGKGEYTLFANQSEWPIMQYTGLKDRKGNPIYEGDILKEDFTEKDIHKSTGIVEFYEGSFGSRNEYGRFRIPALFSGKATEGMNLNYYEVIGNIYQNPELIP